MATTEEKIAKAFSKDITAKTVLVPFETLEETKKKYIDEGWELVNVVPCNGKFKVTFRKVK